MALHQPRDQTLEATPISATDRSRPEHQHEKWSRAAPAIASTLSSDIDTSAASIWNSACAKRLLARAPPWPRSRLPARLQLAIELPRDAQQQQPARQRQADDGEKLHRHQRQARSRSAVAMTMPARMTPAPQLRRKTRRRHADGDRIVAGRARHR